MATRSTEVTVIDQPREVKSVIADMADRFHMEPPAFEAALRATVVPKDCAPAQFAAFLMVAKEYNLNPLTKEIYAFPSRGGGIVPIVSVDGWVNLVNAQGQCDGFSFEMEHDGDKLISCTCSMYRKDRTHPVVVTEYYAECVRSTDPWKMKHRMLRHKALIQAARYAFGFSGIYDEDEGQKIAEIDPNRDAGPPRQIAKPAEPASEQAEPPAIEAEDVRDGDPPPREAKPEKEDPISSGPPRKPATRGDNPVTEIKMAKPAAESGPKPHRIPGAGHTFESWAEKFSDLVKTSEDTATVFKWIDENSRNFTTPDAPTPQKGPLERLKEKKPSVYSDVRKTIEATMESLRDAQQKSAEKASKKAAAKGDMDDEPAKPGQSVSSSSQITPQNPDDILAIIEQELAAVDDPDNLQEVWERVCDPLVEKLDFPPDKDLAQGIFSKHEKRLGGD